MFTNSLHSASLEILQRSNVELSKNLVPLSVIGIQLRPPINPLKYHDNMVQRDLRGAFLYVKRHQLLWRPLMKFANWHLSLVAIEEETGDDFARMANVLSFLNLFAHREIFSDSCLFNRNQTVLATLRLIWNLMEFRLVSNQSGNGRYNLSLVDLTRIRTKFCEVPK